MASPFDDYLETANDGGYDLSHGSIIEGDTFDVLGEMPENEFHAIVCDPPYNYEDGFMQQDWDDIGSPQKYQEWCQTWAEKALTPLKPGGHVIAFSGETSHHRLMCGLQDAGYELRHVIEWHYGCLDTNTEILTTDGWKSYNEISTEDVVFSYDYEHRTRNDTGQVVTSDVNHVFEYEHKGEMVHLDNDDTDQLLTTNHKVLSKSEKRSQVNGERSFKTVNDEWRYVDAGSMTTGGRYTLPLSAKYDGNNSVGGTLRAELIGWILAEGWFQGNAINISQFDTDDGHVSRIRYILGRLGVDYTEYEKERVYCGEKKYEYQFYLHSSDFTVEIQELIPNCEPTRELWHLPSDEKESLFDGLMKGDGSYETKQFYQKDDWFKEWFQTFCHLIGRQARINHNKDSVSYEESATTQVQSKHLSNGSLSEDYDGIVWCINTDVGNFFARRNGHIFITGNSGFPKGPQLSTWLDGEEAEQWGDWRGMLKPATEYGVMARAPFSESSSTRNQVEHGTGNLNVEACRIGTDVDTERPRGDNDGIYGQHDSETSGDESKGRYPPNVALDPVMAEVMDLMSGERKGCHPHTVDDSGSRDILDDGGLGETGKRMEGYDDSGGASRFFYCSKAAKSERTHDGEVDNDHETVKPIDLMEWLVKMVTAEGQKVLDPFLGSGTTMLAAENVGRECVGIEREPEYVDIAQERWDALTAES